MRKNYKEYVRMDGQTNLLTWCGSLTRGIVGRAVLTVALTASLLLISGFAHAQTKYVISGTVRTVEGLPIPGVTVQAVCVWDDWESGDENPCDPPYQETETNDLGQYALSVPDGWYGTIRPVSPLFRALMFTPRPQTSVQPPEGDEFITYSDVSNNYVNENFEATPKVVYVDKTNAGNFQDGRTWDTAFSDVQIAIEEASESYNGGEVWIAQGVYNERRISLEGDDPVNIGSIEMRPLVHLYGGFAGNETALEQRDYEKYSTVLDGSTSRDGLPAYHVIRANVDPATVLDGFTVRGGRSADVGGGLYNMSLSMLVVQNCRFEDNKALLRGGAIFNFSQGTNFTMTNCVIENNEAGQWGGGLYNRFSSPTFTDCLFRLNTAGEDGGAVHTHVPTGMQSPVFTNCSFERNTAGRHGGAVAGYSPEGRVYPTFTNCIFTDNVATENGGAVWSYAPYNYPYDPEDEPNPPVPIDRGLCLVKMTNCEFYRNRSKAAGGAVYTYTDNMNESSSTPDPGSYCTVILTTCKFKDNRSALDGGAVCSIANPGEESLLEVTDGLFTNNRSSSGSGGAIYNYSLYGTRPGTPPIRVNYGWATTKLDRCIFSSNIASLYGGAVCSSGVFSMTYDNPKALLAAELAPETEHAYSCLFIANQSGDDGGAMAGLGTHAPNLINCLFEGNRSSENGGAVRNDAEPTILNCTFSNNVAGYRDEGNRHYGGAVYYYRYDTPYLQRAYSLPGITSPIIKDSILWDNECSQCDGWSNDEGWSNEIEHIVTVEPEVTYSDIQGFYPGVGNIQLDPLFQDSDGGNLRLTYQSPCRDAGAVVQDAPEAWALDLDGQHRLPVSGYTADMGAYEYVAGLPVASFGADIVTGQAPLTVIFTDTSVPGGSPITAWLWTFDGGNPISSTAQNPGPVVFSAPGEYTISLKVTNAAGSSVTVKARYIIVPGGGRIWYVDKDNVSATVDGATWDTAFTRIQRAIRAAEEDGGGEVWVAVGATDGIYNEQRGLDPSGALVLKEDVQVYGGFIGIGTGTGARETHRDERDPATNVVTIDGSAAMAGARALYTVMGADNAVIDGFRIVNGAVGMRNSGASPTVTDCEFSGNDLGMHNLSGSAPVITLCRFKTNKGQGALLNESCSPELTNVLFSGNEGAEATLYSGGITNRQGSAPKVTNCTFEKNKAGAMFNNTSAPEITGCTFSENQGAAFAGGITNALASTPEIIQCTFTSNAGGAIRNADSTPEKILNCRFIKNTSPTSGGAILNRGSSPMIANCLFAENVAAGNGGAISNESGSVVGFSSPTICQCTFFNNGVPATYNGVGIYSDSTSTTMSAPVITNSVVWWNLTGLDAKAGIADGAKGASIVSYCDARGWDIQEGTANLNEDPMLAAPADGDYHLTRLSPAVNAGTPSPCPSTDRDLENIARPQDGGWDMGVFEYVAGTLCSAHFTASVNQGQAPLDVTFTDMSDPGSCEITTWEWDFGDGGTSTEQNPVHRYLCAGVYNVKLKATTCQGICLLELDDVISVTPGVAPAASFTASPVQGPACLEVRFDNTTELGSAANVTCLWEFGDGQTSDRLEPLPHTYCEEGSYDVCLTITSCHGESQFCDTVNVTSCVPPTASFTQTLSEDQGCILAKFTNTSDIGTMPDSQCLWDFGDGETSNQCIPAPHQYCRQGIYSVSLTVTTACGTDSEFKQDVITVGTPITFNDPILSDIICAALGRPSGCLIFQDDLDTITELDLSHRGISSLTGLEYLRNLVNLNLLDNVVIDLTPLAGLTKLDTLNLRQNQISSVAPLSGLTALTTLDIGENRVQDLAPLAGLTHLLTLSLDHNSIANLGSLSGMKHLTTLALNANYVTTITPLSGLTALTSLNLARNRIADVAALQDLVNLTSLNLDVNWVRDLTPLVGNTGFASGDQISLLFNPLSVYTLCSGIPALSGRGVTVAFQGHCPQSGEGIRESLQNIYAGLLNEPDPLTADRDTNSIIDFDHATLIDTMLTNPNAPNSALLRAAWELNYRKVINALADVPETAWAEVSPVELAKTVAFWFTIGETGSVEDAIYLLSVWYDIPVNPAQFDRSNSRYVAAMGDADFDLLCNLGEYNYWYQAGQPEHFADAALDPDVVEDGGGCPATEGEGEGEGEGEVPDAFTTLFDTTHPALSNLTVAFTPVDSDNYYAACARRATAFVADPTGGDTLTLGDDSFVRVDLSSGHTVSLYGEEYASFFVGSNGYITFDEGDASYEESLAAHFAAPRISALFNDLAPNKGGSVTVREFLNLVAVTFNAVPERGTMRPVSFQIAMYYDGRIVITWLANAISVGLVGLSAGTGVPENFENSNFRQYVRCEPGIIEPGLVCTAPEAPGSITATDGQSGGIEVTWSAVPGATEYRLFRSTTPNLGAAAPVTGWVTDLAFTDTQAAPPVPGAKTGCVQQPPVYTYYYYWVQARSDADTPSCVGDFSAYDSGYVGEEVKHQSASAAGEWVVMALLLTALGMAGQRKKARAEK